MHGKQWNIIEMCYESNVNVGYDFVYTICLETLSEDRDGWCRCDVRCWSDTRSRTRHRSVRDTSVPVPKCPLDTSAFGPFIKCWDSSSLVPKCPKDTSAPAEKVRHFGTKDIVPNCLGSEVSRVRSVRRPFWLQIVLATRPLSRHSSNITRSYEYTARTVFFCTCSCKSSFMRCFRIARSAIVVHCDYRVAQRAWRTLLLTEPEPEPKEPTRPKVPVTFY